jgi:hypothetical protein
MDSLMANGALPRPGPKITFSGERADDTLQDLVLSSYFACAPYAARECERIGNTNSRSVNSVVLKGGGPLFSVHFRYPLSSLTALSASTTLDVLNRSKWWHRGGEFFAETHVSTESAPSPQDPWVSRAHED